MLELRPETSARFIGWLADAPRPHVGALTASELLIDDVWRVDLRRDGQLLHKVWRTHAGTRLLWTREAAVPSLIRTTRQGGWEWVRSATTAWRVLHSVKGRPLPAELRWALADVLKDPGAARFALDATRLEAVLASTTARGICVDSDALNAARTEMGLLKV